MFLPDRQEQVLKVGTLLLTRHLGTDGTGCTRDEDALSTKHLADGYKIDLNLVARKEVFNFNLAELLMAEV